MSIWSTAPVASAQTRHSLLPYQLKRTIPLNFSSWCYDAWAAQSGERGDTLALADAANGQVDLINPQSWRVTPVGSGHFAGPAGCPHFDFSQMGPSAVAYDQENRIWASDGDSTVKVFSATPDHRLLTTLATGNFFRTDSIAFDPASQTMLVVNPSDNFVTLWSTRTLTQLSRLDFAVSNILGKAIWEGNGQYLMTIVAGGRTGVNELTVANQQLVVTNTWFLPGTCAVTKGLAVSAGHQAVIGCGVGTGPASAWHLNLTTSKITQITLPPGTTRADLVSEANCVFAITAYSDPNTPGHVVLVDPRGAMLQDIEVAPMAHSVFLWGKYLLIPEIGVGLAVYERRTASSPGFRCSGQTGNRM
jgi:WD40 repeat protein